MILWFLYKIKPHQFSRKTTMIVLLPSILIAILVCFINGINEPKDKDAYIDNTGHARVVKMIGKDQATIEVDGVQGTIYTDKELKAGSQIEVCYLQTKNDGILIYMK